MERKEILESIKAILDKKYPFISNLANVASILFKMDNLNWAGFYLLKDNYLYLGPFQGDVACVQIKIGNGVCGTSVEEKKTIIVDDVNKFKNHIACSVLSKSEIVVPIFKNDSVIGVIDLDAPIYNRFDKEDQKMLEEVANLLSEIYE